MQRVPSGVVVLLATPLLALAGCAGDEGPTDTLSGAVARVVSPHGAEGAAIIEFAGTVDSVDVAVQLNA